MEAMCHLIINKTNTFTNFMGLTPGQLVQNCHSPSEKKNCDVKDTSSLIAGSSRHTKQQLLLSGQLFYSSSLDLDLDLDGV